MNPAHFSPAISPSAPPFSPSPPAPTTSVRLPGAFSHRRCIKPGTVCNCWSDKERQQHHHLECVRIPRVGRAIRNSACVNRPAQLCILPACNANVRSTCMDQSEKFFLHTQYACRLCTKQADRDRHAWIRARSSSCTHSMRADGAQYVTVCAMGQPAVCANAIAPGNTIPSIKQKKATEENFSPRPSGGYHASSSPPRYNGGDLNVIIDDVQNGSQLLACLSALVSSYTVFMPLASRMALFE